MPVSDIHESVCCTDHHIPGGVGHHLVRLPARVEAVLGQVRAVVAAVLLQ